MDPHTLDAPCPCGSGASYRQCCAALHQGGNAASAEALMRSRYSAYCLGLGDYLAYSWHPDTRPQDPLGSPIKWVGLEIVSANQSGPDAAQAEVEFCARYLEEDRLAALCERSHFVRLEGRWVYLDGEVSTTGTTSPQRIGRNQPCPCGSGLKFKRCHGI